MMGWSVAPLARGNAGRAGAVSSVSRRLLCFTNTIATSLAQSVVIGGLVAAAAFGSGCHDPECEAARLELARTWETLRDTAISRKQIPEGSNLTQGQEQDRIRIWTTIEDRAELIRSSFETSQVTWPSADKARADLGEAFKPIASNDDPMTRGFALTLAEADQHMASFRKTCR
jgi:hypothetical protein